MLLPPGLLVVLSVFSDPSGLGFGLAAAGVWTSAAYLLREGLRAEAAFAHRRIARRPALPRKILAALFCGLGSSLAATASDAALTATAIYGVAAMALHLVAFGLDPLRNKSGEGLDDFQRDRVSRAVDDAEAYLAAMTEAAERTRDREVETRVQAFQDVARDLFRTVENDPRDLVGARRYLTVYLMGARDATLKFADLAGHGTDLQARRVFLDLLTDLEQNFAARTRKLLQDDRTDLTVEIDVLRDRLQREGLHLDRS